MTIPQYVNQIALEQGIPITTVYLTKSTDTCNEKAALLREMRPEEGWKGERVIKAVYGLVDWDPVLFIMPELRQRIMGQRRTISGGVLRKRRKRLRPGRLDSKVVQDVFAYAGLEYVDPRPFIGLECIPASMERGTCTPFISETEMKRLNDFHYRPIKGIFIHDKPNLDGNQLNLDNLVVDISIGGKGEEAHKTSLHLSYGAIYQILRTQFGEKVHKIPFWN